MEIISFKAENFRNIKLAEIKPQKETNVFLGENAQGKTNIIEGLWCFTGLKSFRGAKDNELINFDAEQARLFIEFMSEERNQTAEIILSREKNRKIVINGIEENSNELLQKFHAVVFSPEHLQLVKSGAEERRRFLNSAISALYPSYRDILKKYKRALKQRNAILKDTKFEAYMFDFLDEYEKVLARLCSNIIMMRKKYIKRIGEYLPKIYEGISGGKEELSFEYFASAGESEEEIRESFKKSRLEDIRAGVTSVGAHRDDLIFKINGKSARDFGSQGQQRSIVLSLKLSEAELLNEVSGELPIILLDDVLSELDKGRQDYLLNHIKGRQVFITCCEEETANRLENGKLYEISGGNLK